MRANPSASDAYVNNLFQVNLFGHMNITRAILSRFRAQGHGRIAFTSSSSVWGPLPYMSHYAAAKAALSAYAESLHKEVGPLGIRCVDFMCGGFATNLGQPRETGQVAFGAEGTQITAYEPLLRNVVGMFASDPMSFMPGDLTKVAAIMVDIIKGEGIASGRQWAMSVALGSDSFDSGKQRSQDQLKLLDEWKDVSIGTDRDDHSHVTSKKYLEFASMLEHAK
jgi:NAD(P)-dependent dehydrogenase (short-subunit alcohol dehydrogenase family)